MQKIDFDIFTYSFFCGPCLMGQNASKVDTYPGCISHTIAYTFLGYISILSGLLMSEIILPGTNVLNNVLPLFCLNLNWGLYGSRIRRSIRQKYNIYDTETNDFLLHCLVPQCGICIDAQDIRNNEKGLTTDYQVIIDSPLNQEMEK